MKPGEWAPLHNSCKIMKRKMLEMENSVRYWHVKIIDSSSPPDTVSKRFATNNLPYDTRAVVDGGETP